MAKFAKRRGAAARWFPNLMDMEPEEAKRRVTTAIKKWKHGPSKMRDHEPQAAADLTGIPLDDPSKMSPVDPSTSIAKVRDLKSTSNRSILNAVGAARLPVTEAAFNLVDRLANIAGLPKDSTKWPEPWRHASPLIQSWLTELNERPFVAEMSVVELCASAAIGVMKRGGARAGARRTIRYFEPAIKALADEMDALFGSIRRSEGNDLHVSNGIPSEQPVTNEQPPKERMKDNFDSLLSKMRSRSDEPK